MKTFTSIAFLASKASLALAACNADNVLWALQNNAAKASPFCSTYTLPPPNQPLPTYVSQYPASRVSSGCSCLITPGPTTLTTSATSSTLTSTPTTTPSTTPSPYQCSGNLIKNGGFQTIVSGDPPPWEIALPVNPNSGQESRASIFIGASGENYAALTVQNSPTGGYGSTYIRQTIPGLCRYVTYTLTYDSQITINGGQPGLECRVEINLNDQQLVYIGPPNGDRPPFSYQTRSYNFTYSGNQIPQALTIRFTCTAPSGMYIINNISLVGSG